LWFDGARFAYNLGVEHANTTNDYSKKNLRAGAGVSTGKKRNKTAGETNGPDGWKLKAPERLWSVPAKIRDAALMDVHKACAALAAKERTLKRKLKFRTAKDRTQTIYIESQALNCKTTNSVFALRPSRFAFRYCWR